MGLWAPCAARSAPLHLAAAEPSEKTTGLDSPGFAGTSRVERDHKRILLVNGTGAFVCGLAPPAKPPQAAVQPSPPMEPHGPHVEKTQGSWNSICRPAVRPDDPPTQLDQAIGRFSPISCQSGAGTGLAMWMAMATNSINSTSNPLAEIVANLTKRYDTNGDSALSRDEFGAFLNDFLNGAGARTNSTFGAGTAANTTNASSAAVGIMEGFDPAKLANTAHDTMKYQVGRILQKYPNTPQGLRDALPEIQAIVPGAQITGSAGDKLDFGSFIDAEQNRLGVIDVLRGAHAGGLGWQWQPVE
jgi:hypothetical protein